MSPTLALGALGRVALGWLGAVGRLTLFLAETISHLIRPPFYLREFGQALIQAL